MTTRRSTDETNLANMIRRIVQTLQTASGEAELEVELRPQDTLRTLTSWWPA